MKHGIYRHRGGGEYRTLFTAKDAEVERDIVVYADLKTGVVWTREFSAFHERFQFVREAE